MGIRRLAYLIPFVLATTLALQAIAPGARGISGEITLAPATEETAKMFHEVAEYYLELGDKVDYTYSAEAEVYFAVMLEPDVPLPPIVTAIYMSNTTHGSSVLEAEHWPGWYTFGFGTSNTTTSIVVSFNIHPHESSSYGWLLTLLAAGATIIVVVVIALWMRKKKGV